MERGDEVWSSLHHRILVTEWIRGIFETEQFCSTFPSPHGRVLAFCYCWPFLCLSYPTELRMRAMVNIPSAVFVPHFDRKSPSAQGWRPQFILGRRLLLPGRPYLYDEWNATILDTSSTALRQKKRTQGGEAVIRKFFGQIKRVVWSLIVATFPSEEIGFRWPNENHRLARLKMMAANAGSAFREMLVRCLRFVLS